ncbi:MAG: hypothetical protein K2W95_26900 [Candidatus Obscuribacterales bacterium]|nr:hypothetical protein [Candidatus Obscuribacterales bacterium]
MRPISPLFFIVSIALMVAACTFSAANASDEKSEEPQTGDAAKETSNKAPAPFSLHATTKDRKSSKGRAFKEFGRSLMYPISGHTRENKKQEASVVETGTLKGSAAAQPLAEFDLELLVDESKSMLRRDCPGETSRWEWCGEELSELSRQLSPYVQHGLTLTTFSSDYEIFKNATPEDVVERFDKRPSSDSTRLSMPLNNRIKSFFETRKSNSKPLLIVVITDGVPHPQPEPDLVIDSLIAASKRVNDDKQLTIAFLQIGQESQEGKLFVKEIDDDLVNRGASYDIVKSIPFEKLERVGLVNALVSLVRSFASEPAKEEPAKAEQTGGETFKGWFTKSAPANSEPAKTEVKKDEADKSSSTTNGATTRK